MKQQSKRALILRSVLDFINHGDWEEGDGFLIFGSEAYDKHLGIKYDDDESTGYFDEFLRKLASEIKKLGGADDIAKRISLSSIRSDISDIDLKSFFGSLSQDQRGHIAQTLSSVAEHLARNSESQTAPVRDVSDDMDASLAAEAVDQLENSFARLVTLDEMRRPASPFDGSEYFEEAHRCELAGQRIAAVVLCRAVLEAALISSTDQTGWIKNQMNQQRSYIEAMLIEARLRGLIDGSRFEQGMQVRDAGNDAIHDLIRFHHCFANKVPEIIDGTRKILEDLFGTKPRP